jgi:glutamate synthase (ferredoxin)
MVDLEPLDQPRRGVEGEAPSGFAGGGGDASPSEIDEVKAMIMRHAEYTRSQRAWKILSAWKDYTPRFVKVMPKDYKRVLQTMRRVQSQGLSGDEAIMAAFQENARDLSRVSGN